MPQKQPKEEPQVMTDFLFRGELADVDPEADHFLGLEESRQVDQLILIASESACPAPVREALTSVLGNLYAEGYPSSRMTREEMDLFLDSDRLLAYHRRYGDRRFYKGTEICDFAECLAQKRAARLFANPKAAEKDIFVNVQPLSGAAANNAVYEAFVPPGGTVMGLDLSHGGHLTHGSRFNRSGKRYHIVPYHVNLTTGKIDYDEVRTLALKHKPRMIIGGASAYPWDIEWQTLREIADQVGAILLADISHPAGLAVAGLFSNPVGTAHVTSMTTHKTLCGPRGAMILTTNPEHARKINSAVFPGEQGGPHMNTIAAQAVAFRLAATPQFKQLQQRIVDNAQTMAKALQQHGFTIAYGGTTTHLFLVDLNKWQTRNGVPLKGDLASNLLDLAGLTLNKNALPGDETGTRPGGIRIGTPWISQLGLGKTEVTEIADIMHRLLADVDPFRILTQSGQTLERGKVSHGVLQECRERVTALIKKAGVVQKVRSDYETGTIEVENPVRPTAFAAEHQKLDAVFEAREGWRVATKFGDGKAEEAAGKQGTALTDLGDYGLLQVRGPRALGFVNALATVDLTDLAVGGVRRCAFLDGDANLIDEVLVIRNAADRFGFDTLTLLTSPGRVQTVARWCEAHSDGYVRFDPADIYAKIPGPVAITRQNAAGFRSLSRTAFAVFGPKAGDVVGKVFPEAAKLAPDRVLDVAVRDSRVMVLRTAVFGSEAGWIVLLDEANARAIWQEVASALKGVGAVFGVDARNRLRLASGAPDTAGSKATPAGSFQLPVGLVTRDKTYFVGWQAWLKQTGPATPLKEHSFALAEGPLRRTSLFEEHLKLTRKKNLVPFAGWEMPVLYTGIVEEHEAVRKTCGLFDVTHMGVLDFQGEHVTRFLDSVLTNAVDRVSVGYSQYNYILDPDGKVIDDLLIYRLSPTRYMMVVNASNADKVRDWLFAVNRRDVVIDRDQPTRRVDHAVTMRDLKDPKHGAECRVDLALQGPKALKILLDLAGEDKATRTVLKSLRRSGLAELTLLGLPLVVSRTGYTGEEVGFEIFVHPQSAPKLWTALLEAGAKHGLKPCGLGSRDSTRTEAGFPLYGHELAGRFDITPTEAGYGGFVKRFKPFFIGKRRYLNAEENRTMKVVRFRMNSGGKAVRPEDPVVNTKGKVIGNVTSCTLVNGIQLGMALVTRQGVQEGKGFHVLTLPRTDSAKAEKAKAAAELSVGDGVPMLQEATVMTRFRKPGELENAGLGEG